MQEKSNQKAYNKNMRKTHINTLSGFTLIELIVVTALTVLVMMTVTTMFLTFIISSTKASIEQKVNSKGEAALAKIEFILRNSQKLVAGLDGTTICNNDAQSPMTNIAVQGLDGYITTLQTYPLENGRIASYSTAVNDYYYLTSDEVAMSNLRFMCLSGEEDSYYVGITFDLKIGSSNISDRDTALESFQTGITLRNN